MWFALRGTLCPPSTNALLRAIAAFLGRLSSGLLDRTGRPATSSETASNPSAPKGYLLSLELSAAFVTSAVTMAHRFSRQFVLLCSYFWRP